MKTEVSTYPMVTEVVGLADRELGHGSEDQWVFVLNLSLTRSTTLGK